MIKNLMLDCDGTVLEFISGTFRGPRCLNELNINDDVSDFFYSNVDKFQVFLITNQPDISRGYANLHELESVYRKLMQEFRIIRDFRLCPHDNHENCLCRKPKPGMIDELMQLYNLIKDETLVIGDTWVDILTAKNFGLQSVLIRKPHSWLSNSHGSPPAYLQADFQIQKFAELNDSFFLKI
jgi:D-glycero-D-manno-heptose 1,7-bisphosphate phosphatase